MRKQYGIHNNVLQDVLQEVIYGSILSRPVEKLKRDIPFIEYRHRSSCSLVSESRLAPMALQSLVLLAEFPFLKSVDATTSTFNHYHFAPHPLLHTLCEQILQHRRAL